MIKFCNLRRVALAFVLLCCFGGCAPVKKQNAANTLLPQALHTMGRWAMNNQQQLQLISSGAHFSFSFHGDRAVVYAAVPPGAGHNYMQYEVDGVYRQRVKIMPGAVQPIVLKSSGRGRHVATLYKATEAHTGDVLVQKINGENVQPVPTKQKPLIEFIGNSITCGAAADPSEVPCGTGQYHDQHNAYMAYGPRVARALDVDFILNSVSGIGIYRNWNSDGPTMPQVYEKLDFQAQHNVLWNFNLLKPRIISIALGTNDFSQGDGKRERKRFDSAQFVRHYIQFVQQVKAKNSSAQIALLSSPMVQGQNAILLQNCLTAVKKEIDHLYPSAKGVALFFFKPMQARGCTGHPSVEDHALMAAEALPFFKNLLQ